MDLFAKCEAYTTARECRERGIYPYFHALESRQDTEVIMEGKRRSPQPRRRWPSTARAVPARGF